MTSGFGARWLQPRFLCSLLTLALVLESRSALAHEGLHELIEAQKKAVEKNPSDPGLILELGSLYGQHGELDLALKNLDRVDDLAPGKFPTDFLRAEAFMVARDFGNAKSALDRHVSSHAEPARAWLLRARAENELGQKDASLADYRETLKRTTAPEPDLFQEVAGALSNAGKKEEAAAVLSAGIEKLGKIPSLILRAVDLEIESKNFDAALRRIEQALRDAPRPEPWMARRATVLAQAGRKEESRAAWQALLERIDSLPENERVSRAMSTLAAEARAALESTK